MHTQLLAIYAATVHICTRNCKKVVYNYKAKMNYSFYAVI